MEMTLETSGDPKQRAELNYWKHLSQELTRGCSTRAARRQALLQVCWEKTFPRYKKSLGLTDESFSGMRVLDLGCGPHGGLIGFRNCERWGADHLLGDYRKLGYPLEEHGIHYVHCKSEALPFGAGFFDVVVCVNALDHVDDLGQTFDEVGRVLVAEGRFLAQVNFHPIATPTEPHCFTHEKLLASARRHALGLRKVHYQAWIPQAGEHRYYYELEKNFPRPT